MSARPSANARMTQCLSWHPTRCLSWHPGCLGPRRLDSVSNPTPRVNGWRSRRRKSEDAGSRLGEELRRSPPLGAKKATHQERLRVLAVAPNYRRNRREL